MLTELRQKSQITIPKELIDKLGLLEGDKLEIYEQEGVICMMPVVAYPKPYVEKLIKDVEDINEKILKREQPVFDSVNKLISSLESED